MAKRYSQRRTDGTVEYYDTQAEAKAAQDEDFFEGVAVKFMLAGFVFGGLLAYAALHVFDFSECLKIGKFALVISGALTCSVICTVLSKILYRILIVIIAIGVLYGMGSLLWALL